MGRLLNEKNIGVRGLISEKNGSFVNRTNQKSGSSPPVVIPQESIFYNVFFLCFWLRIIRTSNQAV